MSPSVVDMFKLLCSLSALWKVLLAALVAANFKNFPLIYHLRILNGIRFVLRSQRSSVRLGTQHVFLPLITSSRATMLETDVFGHKSNSTYFSDIDIARTHFVTTVFSKAIEEFRGSTTMNGLSGKPRSAFTMPLGGVSCTFRKELKPYEPYDMWTRILSWDDKWFYLITHFIRRSDNIEPIEHVLYPRQNKRLKTTSKKRTVDSCSSPDICATAISKVVFKDGRKTVAPMKMLGLAGLCEDGQVSNLMATDGMLHGVEEEAMRSNLESGSKKPEKPSSGAHAMRPSHLEQERQRGLKIAWEHNGEGTLKQEFQFDQALGRHSDGHGLEGVCFTLAQLSGLSKYQFL